MIGKKILSYEVKSLLGEGGMGNVYLAEHIVSGEKVAIKSLLPQLARHDSIRERFKIEAETMLRLSHPHIVKIIFYKEDGDGAYIIMEYVEGIDLNKYIKTESGPLPKEKAVDLMTQILTAFSYAHENTVIHRDIKPSNMLLAKNGQIKVIDFGIAKVLSEADKKLTKTGLQMGAVFYMSPEQVRGKEVDKRSDIYSLGVTFFQILSGQSPYESMTTEYEVYSKIVNEPLPSVKDIYPAVFQPFDKVIAKATAKDPANRYDNCNQFLQAITKAAALDPGAKTDNSSNEENTDNGAIKRQKISTAVWVWISLIFLATLILGGWQCSVHSQYKDLISKAEQNYNSQLYSTAIYTYEEALEKRKMLLIGRGDDDIESLIKDCNFEMYKNVGINDLKQDSFSLSTRSDYKFTALEDFQAAAGFRYGDDFVTKRITLCEGLRDAIDKCKQSNYTDASSLYQKAASYAAEIGEDNLVIEHINNARTAISKPSAKFLRVWVDHNATENYATGMRIHFQFDTHFMYNRNCNVTVWFYDENNIGLSTTNTAYSTPSGKIGISQRFYPVDNNYSFDDFSIFMPYSGLDIPAGTYKFDAAIIADDSQIVYSDYTTFVRY
jgi:serine/threonine protein kinase